MPRLSNNKPADIAVLTRIEQLSELVGGASRVIDRILMIERANQGCDERITGAFRWDPRSMALACTLKDVVHALASKSLQGIQLFTGWLSPAASSPPTASSSAGPSRTPTHLRPNPRHCLLHQAQGLRAPTTTHTSRSRWRDFRPPEHDRPYLCRLRDERGFRRERGCRVAAEATT
jgi:hypothetical protein